MSDLKHAFRQLANAPGFTAVIVLSLALGIGAIATVLCWTRHLVELRRVTPLAKHIEAVFLPQRMASLLLLLLGGVPLLLAAVVVVACYVPARRATRINPVEALRAE